MKKEKTIAIVGATGAQGGGLVRAILNDKTSSFKVRAITRNSKSEKAQELQKMGAEIVEADVEDKASLVKAFKGAYGAFCVTFFWEHFSPEKEKEHAKNMADAAKEAGIQHVIWSTLEDTRNWVPLNDDRMPTLMGHYKVPHFDAKGEANQFFIDSGVPYTLLLTSFYWDNFINFGLGPKKGESDEYYITFPISDKKLPGIAAEDIGKTVYNIFKAGDQYKNQSVGIAGEHLTGQQMAEIFSEEYKKKVLYNAVEPSTYRSFDFPGADDLGNMFQFTADFEDEFCRIRDVEKSRQLNPELLSFKQWVKSNKEKMQV